MSARVTALASIIGAAQSSPPPPPSTLTGVIAEQMGAMATEGTVAVGLACLAAQIVLYVAFAHVLPAGPWKVEPGFTAHQVVVLPLMIYMAYIGNVSWWPHFGASEATFDDRVFQRNAVGEHLAQLAICELLFWDIPTGLAVKSMRDPVMMGHHIGMLMAAYIGTQVTWSYYAIFFFGTCEVSGIFLSIVDVFHPKHKEWAALSDASPLVGAINNVARVAFVLAYALMRAVYFPWVVFANGIPDLIRALALPTEQRANVSDTMMFAPWLLGVPFCLLQWYWGVLLVKQIVKVLSPKPANKKSQ